MINAFAITGGSDLFFWLGSYLGFILPASAFGSFKNSLNKSGLSRALALSLLNK
jgi:hypothetical protein